MNIARGVKCYHVVLRIVRISDADTPDKRAVLSLNMWKAAVACPGTDGVEN